MVFRMPPADPDDAEDLLEAELDQVDDEHTRTPLDAYADFEPQPIAVAPDGGPAIEAMGPPAAVPPATPELFVCLRGPCRHYWEIETHLASGNPADTWGPDGLKDEDGNAIRAPRQITRACTYQAGIDTQFTDDIVYACNRWDPIIPIARVLTALRRRAHALIFPASKE